MTAWRIPLAIPKVGQRERRYLDECITSGFVSSVGPFVTTFEERMAAYIGSRYAVACSSGTAALHLASVSLAAHPHRRDVLVSDLTFIATVNAITYAGLSPVLVDSEPNSWNLDTDLVIQDLHARSRNGRQAPAAVLAVHLLGYPAELDELASVCAALEVPLVEDAAEALGARWQQGGLSGQMVGTAGHIGCFSFNGNKLITTGGGGLVTTDDESLAGKVRHLSTQARSSATEYEHDAVGFNYRLSNLAAAVGLAQLDQIDELLAARRSAAKEYAAIFANVPQVTPAPSAPHRSSHWLSTILLEDMETRDRVRASLGDAGIESRTIWRPMHTQLPYREAPRIGSGEVADRIWERALSLPSSPTLRKEDIAEVGERVLNVLVERPITHR